MTKYHAHEAIIATGPTPHIVPDVDEFLRDIPNAFWPLIISASA